MAYTHAHAHTHTHTHTRTHTPITSLNKHILLHSKTDACGLGIFLRVRFVVKYRIVGILLVFNVWIFSKDVCP